MPGHNFATPGGTSVDSPVTTGIATMQYVSLLEGHSYALSYHSFRSMADAISAFTFFANTDVIYADVPAPATLLLFGTGLLGLRMCRKLSSKRDKAFHTFPH